MEHRSNDGRILRIKQPGMLEVGGRRIRFREPPSIEIYVENSLRMAVTPETALEIAADLILQATELIRERNPQG